MSLQWVEGFETRRHEDLFAELYESHSFNTSTPFIAGRLHGFAWDGKTVVQHLETTDLEADDVWIIGVAAQINAPDDSNDAAFITIKDGSSAQLSLYVREDTGDDDDYTMELWRGDRATGTLLQASAITQGGDGYNYWELKVLIANSGGTWELRRNGVVLLNGVGDTQETGNASATRVRFETEMKSGANVGSPRFDLDDIYICNGNGTFNNDFLGDQVVEGILPDGAGSSTQWDPEDNGSPSGNPNYQEVNDASTGSPDNDTGYVTAQSAGEKDRYTFENLSYITGDINGVMIVNRARVEATGLRVLKNVFDDGTNGEADAGAPFNVDNATWDDYPVIVERNPATSGLFTVAQINSGEFGIEIVS